MNIYLAISGICDPENSPLPEWKDLKAKDKVDVHQICDDPEKADVIIFTDVHQQVEPHLPRIRKHPLWIKYGAKCFVYDERDHPYAPLPGIYPSLPRPQFSSRIHSACAYFHFLHYFDAAFEETPDLLFSFCGAISHPVRQEILTLKHERSIVEDSAISFFDFNASQSVIQKQNEQRLRYESLLRRSKFVLCPRGSGVSSFRLFEVMAAGRVPVIISNDWVEPPEVDWTTCALRVPENSVNHIGDLIRLIEPRFEDMAQQSRLLYEKWFGPEVTFHNLVEKCLELKRLRSIDGQRTTFGQDYYINYLRYMIRHLKKMASRRA